MKTKFILAALCFAALSSCDKELDEIFTVEKKEKVEVIGSTPGDDGGTWDVVTHGVWVESALNCLFGTYVNCTQVTIYPATESERLAFDAVVDGDANDVATYFNGTSWQSILPDFIGTNQLISLQSGNYDIIAVGTDDCYICGPYSTLSTSNVEFAIQFD